MTWQKVVCLVDAIRPDDGSPVQEGEAVMRRLMIPISPGAIPEYITHEQEQTGQGALFKRTVFPAARLTVTEVRGESPAENAVRATVHVFSAEDIKRAFDGISDPEEKKKTIGLVMTQIASLQSRQSVAPVGGSVKSYLDALFAARVAGGSGAKTALAQTAGSAFDGDGVVCAIRKQDELDQTHGVPVAVLDFEAGTVTVTDEAVALGRIADVTRAVVVAALAVVEVVGRSNPDSSLSVTAVLGVDTQDVAMQHSTMSLQKTFEYDPNLNYNTSPMSGRFVFGRINPLDFADDAMRAGLNGKLISFKEIKIETSYKRAIDNGFGELGLDQDVYVADRAATTTDPSDMRGSTVESAFPSWWSVQESDLANTVTIQFWTDAKKKDNGQKPFSVGSDSDYVPWKTVLLDEETLSASGVWLYDATGLSVGDMTELQSTASAPQEIPLKTDGSQIKGVVPAWVYQKVNVRKTGSSTTSTLKIKTTVTMTLDVTDQSFD